MKKIDQIAIGAILHDIGKFSQRAKIDNKYLNDDSEKQRICKKDRYGNFSYYHSLYTSLFMEENKKFFPKIEESFEKPEDNFINFASCHHNPRTVIGELIKIADELSSGMDRIPSESEEESNNFRKQKLISIFSGVNLVSEDEDSYSSYSKAKFVHSICPLDYYSPDSNIFFPKPEEEKVDLTEDYKKNWYKFINEFEKINQDDALKFFIKLKYLLEKYTWCIPSSTIDFPDISLFDHLYTTATIAVTLYQYHNEKGFNEKDINDKKIQKFLLISGDLSGIQKYIYNIYGNSTKGSAKILRSRSLYLELLNEISSRFLIEKLNLHYANLLYSIGGKFLIMAPNTDIIKNKLEEAETEITNWFFNNFKGELSLNIASQEFSGEDLNISNFSKKFRELIQKIEIKKKQKFSSLLLKNISTEKFIFDDNFSKYENGTCSFCGKEPAELNENTKAIENNITINNYSAINEEEPQKLCFLCNKMKLIGEKLPFVEYLAYSKDGDFKDDNILSIDFFDNKYKIYFFKKIQNINEKKFFEIYSLKSDEKYPVKLIFLNLPNNGSETLSFEDISNQSCLNNNYSIIQNLNCLGSNNNDLNDSKNSIDSLKNIGQKMLGVLRADVDNMGLIFSYGFEDKKFEQSKLSISRYFSLSRMFNFYFNGYLKNVISFNENYKNIYTVYSGGDDLFFIGPWDVIVDFALYMHNSFKKYVCNNNDIKISAAIGLFKPSFPVSRFASRTEKMLEKSKAEIKENNKNNTNQEFNLHGDKITIFNKSLEWDTFEKLLSEGRFLESELIKNKIYGNSKITSSFIYRLFTYSKMEQKFREENKVEMLKYKSLFVYDVSRNIVEKNNDVIINEELVTRIYNLVFNDNKFKDIIVPLSWALYKTRKSS